MGDVVNLNQYRKKRDRTLGRGRATAARAKHGLAKVERTLLKDRRARDAKLLSDKRMDRGDPDDPLAAG